MTHWGISTPLNEGGENSENRATITIAQRCAIANDSSDRNLETGAGNQEMGSDETDVDLARGTPSVVVKIQTGNL